MFLISRDMRMAGAGLPEEFSGYFVEGWTTRTRGRGHAGPGADHGQHRGPLNLPIRNYQGSSVVLDVEDFSFEQ